MTEIRETVAECLPHKNPLVRPDYTEFEVQSVRALARGKASERQQIAALEYMMRAFGTHDISYRPNDPHGSAFAEGKRFAGTTLVWMLKSAPTRTDPDKTATREMDDND
jgi:hypothetical protein